MARRQSEAAGSGGGRSLWEDERGVVATLDFLLVFPLFMAIVLMIAQLALLANARIVVGQAAYLAARAAIVHTDGGRAEVEEVAMDAASIGLMPISPRPPFGGDIWDPGLLPLFVLGPETPYLDGGELGRRWPRGFAKRLVARARTSIEIVGADRRGRFAPDAWVTVKVKHYTALVVPYADGVIGLALGGLLGPYIGVPIEDSFTMRAYGREEFFQASPEPCRTLGDMLLDLLKRLFGG